MCELIVAFKQHNLLLRWSMVRIEQCDPEICDDLRDQASRIFPQERSRFTDRSQRFVSESVSVEPGHYFSMRHDVCPSFILGEFGRIAPRLSVLALDQAYINVYPPGSYTFPHSDYSREGQLEMVIVPLQSHAVQGVTWFDEQRNAHHVVDEIGRALIFDSLETIYEVPIVIDLRFSVVFFYR